MALHLSGFRRLTSWDITGHSAVSVADSAPSGEESGGNLLHEEFEMQMRGYSRRQVDDFVARRNGEIRDLEQRLARTLDEAEHLRREVATVRQQALAGRPAHEEVSERIAQILKLADDEGKAQRGKADDEIAKLRAEAQQESERVRA